MQTVRYSSLLLRAAVGFAIVAATPACSDMLGLEGLNFEEPEDSTTSTDLSGTNLGGGTGLGDSLTARPEPYRDFPAEWEPDSILASAPLDVGSAYSNYSPTTGKLSRFVTRPTEPDFEGDHLAPKNWSHIVLVPLPEAEQSENGDTEELSAPWDEVGILGYDTETGLFEYFTAPFSAEELSGSVHSGSPGWTEFVLLWAEGDHEPSILAYNRPDGRVRVGRAIPQMTQGEVTSHEWSTGWDELVRWTHGEESGVLKLDFEGKVIQFEAFLGRGKGMEPRWEIGLLDPWTSAMSFQPPGEDGPRLLLYDGATGAATSVGITETEPPGILLPASGLTLKESWPSGITALHSLTIGSTKFALTHNSSTGVADALQVHPLYSSVTVR